MKKRNLELRDRNEETREKFQSEVVRFKLDQIYRHYNETINAIYAQFDIADQLMKEGKNKEAENIWGNEGANKTFSRTKNDKNSQFVGGLNHCFEKLYMIPF